MAKFILKIVVYSTLIGLLAIGTDALLSNMLRQTKEYPGEFEVMNDIYASKAVCDVAIYGSSRAWNHVDPRILHDSLQLSFYNFGINGQNFWLQHLRHREFLAYNVRPTYILMSLDMFTFQPKNELYNTMQFYPYMLWNENVRTYTKSYLGFKTMDYYVPLVRYSGKRKALSAIVNNTLGPNRNAPNFRFRGFTGLDKPWTDDFDNAKSKLGFYRVEVDGSLIKLFDEFLNECAMLNIKVILVYSPEYIQGQEFVANRDSIFTIFQAAARKYKLHFLDYSQDELCKSKELFFNASHLNKTGADIFSRKLAHDLQPILDKSAR
jgi:hypothetical protein